MARLYKISEFQGGSGQWYANCIDDLAGLGGQWWVPSRVLNMTAAQYVDWLIKTYKPDHITFDKILIFSWDKENYSRCHAYVLAVNRIARQKKFMI